mmetsp:Transcript_23936/g.71953  ORF Transcript_23936/g.71953 Transcript_23936/m.71953 type:complete len:90 (+) Transcript_23936:325-594(+)
MKFVASRNRFAHLGLLLSLSMFCAEVFKYFTEIKPLAAYALGVTIVCQGNRVVLEIFEIRAKRESREAEEADARASKAAAKGGNPKKKR